MFLMWERQDINTIRIKLSENKQKLGESNEDYIICVHIWTHLVWNVLINSIDINFCVIVIIMNF